MEFKEVTLPSVLAVLIMITGQSRSAFTSESHTILKRSLDVSVENETWNHLLSRMNKQFDKLWSKESHQIIPEIHFHRLKNSDGKFPESIAHKIRRRGIIIVREVLSKTDIQKEQSNLVEYIFSNQSLEDNDFKKLDEIRWSKAQQRLRQKENLNRVERALLNLFHSYNRSSEVNLNTPVTLVSGLRIRVPKKDSDTSSERILMSGNCLEKWRNPAFRQIYRHILHNKFEDYDPFEIDHRLGIGKDDVSQEQNFLRLFQGWLALSPVSTGTLKTVPLLKEATAYIILRPFMKDVPTDLFPGCSPKEPLELSPEYHQLLYYNMVPVPELNPGDAVWWHEDLVHSERNDVMETESIMRLSTGPNCYLNKKYLRKQRHAFILRKNPFTDIHEKNFRGVSNYKDLSALGKEMMGWSTTTSSRKEKETCFCI